MASNCNTSIRFHSKLNLHFSGGKKQQTKRFLSSQLGNF